MGFTLNPRGTAGSGKTELVRRILGLYSSRPRPGASDTDGLEALYRPAGAAPSATASSIHTEVDRSGSSPTTKVRAGAATPFARWMVGCKKPRAGLPRSRVRAMTLSWKDCG